MPNWGQSNPNTPIFTDKIATELGFIPLVVVPAAAADDLATKMIDMIDASVYSFIRISGG